MTLQRVATVEDLVAMGAEDAARIHVARLNVFGQVGGQAGLVGAQVALVERQAVLVHNSHHV
jgi:hypothetical protein